MKRIVCICLAAFLLLLAGCSGESGKDAASGASLQSGTSAAPPAAGESGAAGTASGTSEEEAQPRIPGLKAVSYTHLVSPQGDTFFA